MREKYCWLAGAGWCWFYVREKYYWLDAVKMKRTESEHPMITRNDPVDCSLNENDPVDFHAAETA